MMAFKSSKLEEFSMFVCTFQSVLTVLLALQLYGPIITNETLQKIGVFAHSNTSLKKLTLTNFACMLVFFHLISFNVVFIIYRGL